jgi:glucose-6-phosphate isomerase
MTIDARLMALAASLPPIASLFEAEPGRLAALSFDVEGVHFDFAKLSVSADALAALHDLAIDAGVALGWRRLRRI